ncbi:hypothetical protein [Chondromyces crocatus]|uniref:Uncharacterized protein n=1 Tax=Chondromyces crocatus TaxID=52 RepID=A0A0K1ERC5_CHOCO|nr:hypothetical protein [Chondromyces crocatus]AKT43396.1 uncharacterized protein CMC5_076280 [Chondromyces crocatus]
MKQSAMAALVTVALTLSSSAVLAGAISATGQVVNYTKGSSVITVVAADKSAEQLQILAGTAFRLVDCPDLIPDSTCKNIAIRWNLGRLQNQGVPFFQGLITEMGTSGCGIEYVRVDTQARDGAFGLASVRPAQ